MNPYDVLGVSSTASDKEITKKYKALAKKYHPDLHPDEAWAAEKMGEINRAYHEIKARNRRNEKPQGKPDARAERRVHYHVRPGITPVGITLIVLVTLLLVRFILTLIFGGYSGNYYIYPMHSGIPENQQSYFMPGAGPYP